MKLEMIRHRSRFWRTFLFCMGATGPTLTALPSSINIGEGGAAIDIIFGSIGSN